MVQLKVKISIQNYLGLIKKKNSQFKENKLWYQLTKVVYWLPQKNQVDI